MEDRQLSLSEVAGAMGVSERTVRRWIKSGKLRAYKPGRDYRIPESAVRTLVEESEISPKVVAPTLQRSLFNGLDEERRLHYLRPWPKYVNLLANNVEHEIDQGHVKDLNWWHDFNRDVISLTHLYNQILPPAAEQSEDERLELLKLSEAIARLNQVADKMDKAMEPVIAEMHKELYAKERERRKAAFNAIPRRRSA